MFRVSNPRAKISVSPAQASFLEIEVVGRFLDDRDPALAEMAEQVDMSLHQSQGRSVAVSDANLLADVLLEIVNDMDDAIESGDWRSIGGVDTKSDARNVFKSGQAIWTKLLPYKRM